MTFTSPATGARLSLPVAVLMLRRAVTLMTERSLDAVRGMEKWPKDDEIFCPSCLAGTESSEHFEKCTLPEREEAEPVLLHDGPLAQVWQGDAAKVLPNLPTESLDLVLTDPPYGVDWQSGFRKESFDRLANDGTTDREVVREILRESVRLVGQNRHLYVFGPTDVLEGLKVSARRSEDWGNWAGDGTDWRWEATVLRVDVATPGGDRA
jgi:hypothetical protein